VSLTKQRKDIGCWRDILAYGHVVVRATTGFNVMDALDSVDEIADAIARQRRGTNWIDVRQCLAKVMKDKIPTVPDRRFCTCRRELAHLSLSLFCALSHFSDEHLWFEAVCGCRLTRMMGTHPNVHDIVLDPGFAKATYSNYIAHRVFGERPRSQALDTDPHQYP